MAAPAPIDSACPQIGLGREGSFPRHHGRELVAIPAVGRGLHRVVAPRQLLAVASVENHCAMAARAKSVSATPRPTSQPRTSGENRTSRESCEVDDSGTQDSSRAMRRVGQKSGRMPAYRSRFDTDD